MGKIIGKVIATEKNPTTCDYFYFWTRTGLVLNPFDVVKVDHAGVVASDISVTYGVIEEMSHITDAASFLSLYVSSDFGDVDAKENTTRISLNYIKAKVISNTKGIYIPVENNSRVSLASESEVEEALGLKNIKYPLVCGYLTMYSGEDKIQLPVKLDSRFLIGPEGAHLNISGISGLAAKTSYAMFLMKAIQDKYLYEKAATDDKDDSVAFVFFNVKGKDLLTVDEKCKKDYEVIAKEYKDLGLTAEPFQNVHYYIPYGAGDNKLSNTYLSKDEFKNKKARDNVQLYKYTCEDDKNKIDMLFSNIDDPNETIESIISYIANNSEFENLETWDELKEKIKEKTVKGQSGNKDISVLSWRKFNRIIEKSLSNALFGGINDNDKIVTRLESALQKIKKNEVHVIDISKLDTNMQSFVFGDVVKALYDIKLGVEEGITPPKKIIIFVDELNKYASKDTPKSSPILHQVLDIAERGRSLGIILFAAEQFRSAIHDRVKGNCSTCAYGKTNDIELSSKDYSFIPPTYKNMMTRLIQGEYIIANPVFRSLLNIKFPKPIYLQNK